MIELETSLNNNDSTLSNWNSQQDSVTAFREWLEEQFGLGSEREAFSTAVEDCHNAKTNLENIPFKKPSEVLVINEAKYVLKGSEINLANLSSEETNQI